MTTTPIDLNAIRTRYDEFAATLPATRSGGITIAPSLVTARMSARDVPALLDELAAARSQAARQLTELNRLRAHECVPTQHAYDAACAALHKHRDRADTVVAVLDEIGDTVFRFGAVSDPDAVRDLLAKTQQRAKEAVAVDKRVRENPPAQS